jgi:hypothetical protein
MLRRQKPCVLLPRHVEGGRREPKLINRANRDWVLKTNFSEADDARTNLEETPTSSAPAWSWEKA